MPTLGATMAIFAKNRPFPTEADEERMLFFGITDTGMVAIRVFDGKVSSFECESSAAITAGEWTLVSVSASYDTGTTFTTLTAYKNDAKNSATSTALVYHKEFNNSRSFVG
jgi:hypothetical protein